MISLSIVVPTFNRKKHLEIVCFQLTRILASCSQVNLLIADNASPYDANEFLQPYFQIWRGRLKYYKWKINSGSAEGNLAELLINLPYDDLGTHVWVLGDDDLPSTKSLSFILNAIENLSPNDLLLSHSGLDAKSLVANDEFITFPMPSEYFKKLISYGKFQSIYGATFLSAVIAPSRVFREAFGCSYSHPSCLKYLSFLARNDLLYDKINYRIIATSTPFVSPAFRPISIIQSFGCLPPSRECKNELSIIEYIDMLWMNYCIISGSSFDFEQYDSPASDWFFYSQAKYFLSLWLQMNAAFSSAELRNVPYSLALAVRYFLRFKSRLIPHLPSGMIDFNAILHLCTFSVDFTSKPCAFSPILGAIAYQQSHGYPE